MELITNTSQREDPHGLQAVAELLKHGTKADYEQRVSACAQELERVSALLKRVQKVSPGVEFSPYVMRMLSVAKKTESARPLAVANVA